jgi:chromosome segregation ATPase
MNLYIYKMTMRLFRKFGLPDTGMMTGKMDINTVSQHLGRFLAKQENLGMLTQAVENKTESYGGVDGALEVLKKIDIEKAPNYFRAGFRTIGPQIIKLFAKKGLDITPLQNLWVKFGFDVKLIMDKDQTAKYGGKRGKLAKTRKAHKIHGGAGGKTILMLWIVFLMACLYMSAASAANPRTAQELDTFQELKNGAVTYEGFTRGDVYHGLGELSKGNEKFYMNFIDGQPEKVGTIRYEDGTTFTGEIENYKPKGKGAYFNSHLGLECYGDFQAQGSDIVGLGECRTEEYTYKGELRNFKPHGYGERILTKSKTKFYGTFENGLPEGYGMLHVKNFYYHQPVSMKEGVAEYLTYMDLRNFPDFVKSHFTVSKKQLAQSHESAAFRLVYHQITEEFLNEAKQTSAKASNFLQEIVDTKVQKKTLEDTRKTENTKQLEKQAIQLKEVINKQDTKLAEKEAEKEALIQAYNQQLLLLNPKPESVPKRGKKNRNFNETEMLKFQNEGLQLKISELETKEDLLTQDISDLEKMVDDKMLEIKDNEDHIDRLSEKINSYKSELAYSGLENNLLQSEKANLETKNKTLSKEIVDKTNEIMSYKNQLQNLNQTNSLLSEKNTNLEAEKDFLSKESVDKTNEINSYKSKIDTLNNEISQLNASQSELNVQINSLLKQIESKKTGVTRNNLFEIKELKYALEKIKKSGVYTAIENVAAETFAETSIWPLLIFTLASLKMIHSKITSSSIEKEVIEYESKLYNFKEEIDTKITWLGLDDLPYNQRMDIFDQLISQLYDQMMFMELQLDFFKKTKGAETQVSKVEDDLRSANKSYKNYLLEKTKFLSSQNDLLKEEKNKQAKKLKKQYEKVQNLEDDAAKLIEKNASNIDEIKDLGEQIKKLEELIARKKSEADALQEKIDNLTITNISSDKLNEQLSKEMGEHTATIFELKKQIARIEDHNKREIDTIKRGSKREIASLAQQITEKTSKLGDLTGANTKQTSEIANLQKIIEKNTSEISNLRYAYTKKSKENDKKDRQIKKLEDDIQEKQSRIANLQEDIKKNNSLMANLQIDNKNLKEDNLWYQGHREDYERGQQKFDEKEKELESIIENLGERLKELQEQYAVLEDILKGKVEEIKKYEISQQTPAGIVNMGTAENALKSASEPVSKAVESKAVESEPASEPKGQLDPRFKKYDNMRKFGQEDDAVRQKMNLDGITSDEIERYFSGEPMLLAAAASSTPAAQVNSHFDKNDNMKNMLPETTNPEQEVKKVVILRENGFVEGNFKDTGTWLPGKISKVNKEKDITYDITYNDGNTETQVPNERVRCEDVSEITNFLNKKDIKEFQDLHTRVNMTGKSPFGLKPLKDDELEYEIKKLIDLKNKLPENEIKKLNDKFDKIENPTEDQIGNHENNIKKIYLLPKDEAFVTKIIKYVKSNACNALKESPVEYKPKQKRPVTLEVKPAPNDPYDKNNIPKEYQKYFESLKAGISEVNIRTQMTADEIDITEQDDFFKEYQPLFKVSDEEIQKFKDIYHALYDKFNDKLRVLPVKSIIELVTAFFNDVKRDKAEKFAILFYNRTLEGLFNKMSGAEENTVYEPVTIQRILDIMLKSCDDTVENILSTDLASYTDKTKSEKDIDCLAYYVVAFNVIDLSINSWSVELEQKRKNLQNELMDIQNKENSLQNEENTLIKDVNLKKYSIRKEQIKENLQGIESEKLTIENIKIFIDKILPQINKRIVSLTDKIYEFTLSYMQTEYFKKLKLSKLDDDDEPNQLKKLEIRGSKSAANTLLKEIQALMQLKKNNKLNFVKSQDGKLKEKLKKISDLKKIYDSGAVRREISRKINDFILVYGEKGKEFINNYNNIINPPRTGKADTRKNIPIETIEKERNLRRIAKDDKIKDFFISFSIEFPAENQADFIKLFPAQSDYSDSKKSNTKNASNNKSASSDSNAKSASSSYVLPELSRVPGPNDIEYNKLNNKYERNIKGEFINESGKVVNVFGIPFLEESDDSQSSSAAKPVIDAAAAPKQGININDEKYKKYKIMKKNLIPDAAVQRTMKADGLPQPEIDAFFDALNATPPSNSSDSQSSSVTEPVIDAAAAPTQGIDITDKKYNKYKTMKKNLIPDAAVQRTMKADGLPQAEIDAFFDALNNPDKKGGSKRKSKKIKQIPKHKERFRGGRITKKRRERKMGRSKTKRHIKRR